MAKPNQPEPAANSEESFDPTVRMSFFDHLAELRVRILHSLLAVTAGFALGFYWAQPAFEFLAQPMIEALRAGGMQDSLVYTSPLGPLRLLLSVSLYLGVLIALPVVFYQVWLFVAPGLYRNERRATLGFLFSSVALFLTGTVFGYRVMLPLTLKFLISFEGPFRPMISINDYFDLILLVLLGLGAVFQLPILIFFLSLFGIVTPAFLWRNFRYAVLIIAVLSALITPTTDVFTMSVFMAPMIVLYLLGIGVSWVVVRRKKTARGEEVADLRPVAAVGALALVGTLVWAANHYGWWGLLAR